MSPTSYQAAPPRVNDTTRLADLLQLRPHQAINAKNSCTLTFQNCSSGVCVLWTAPTDRLQFQGSTFKHNLVLRCTHRGWRDVPPGHNIDLQGWIGGGYVGHWQPEFAANHIAALCDGGRFVEGDLAVAALTAKATVAGHNQALGGDVFERFANLGGHIFRPICLQSAMADGAQADLLLEIVLEGLKEFEILLISIFHLERPHVAPTSLQIDFDGLGVAGVLHHALHVGVAPAGVDPQFYVVEPLHFAVERFNHELDLFVVLAKGVGHKVERRLLNLDAPTAGIPQGYQFLIHRFRHIPDHLALVLVLGRVDVQEERHHLRTTRAEFDRLASLSLRDAPQLRVIERPVIDFVDDVRPSPPGVNFVQQRPWRIVEPGRGGLLRLQVVAFEAGPALQRVVVPCATGQVLIDVKVSVREDVEAGALLIADHDG